MGTKTIIITVGLAVLLAGGGTIGYVMFVNHNNEVTQTKEAVDLPLEQAVAGRQTQNNSNLQVKSAPQIQPQNNSNQLPSPQNFEVYEKYATAESTQYIDIRVGTGPEAKTGDTVQMTYQGYLTDGTLFDQTGINEQGQIVVFPFTLGAGQVITGWEQGILGMREGGKRRLIIPSQFGYGPTGQASIPPNAMLIFDVELYKIQVPTE